MYYVHLAVSGAFWISKKDEKYLIFSSVYIEMALYKKYFQRHSTAFTVSHVNNFAILNQRNVQIMYSEVTLCLWFYPKMVLYST